MHKLDKERMSLLYRAVLSLKTEEECAAFFEDACTVQETEAIAQRIEVACQLIAAKAMLTSTKVRGPAPRLFAG